MERNLYKIQWSKCDAD